MFRRKTVLLTLTLAVVVSGVEAQRNYNSGNRRSRIPMSYPRAGNAYNTFGARGAYPLSPYMGYSAPVVTAPALPPVTGPVERYSELEYGEIVKMTIEAARQSNPAGPDASTRRSIVTETTGTLTGETAYQPVATGISDVLDRGILLLPTGEELRLRGVSMPSTTDRNEVSRIYAREGVQMLRNLTQGKEVYVVLDEPVRDSDGRLLGTVFLADGTELNRKMLELGYGSLKAEDFAVGVDYADLTKSQEDARQNRLGLWSKGY